MYQPSKVVLYQERSVKLANRDFIGVSRWWYYLI